MYIALYCIVNITLIKFSLYHISLLCISFMRALYWMNFKCMYIGFFWYSRKYKLVIGCNLFNNFTVKYTKLCYCKVNRMKVKQSFACLDCNQLHTQNWELPNWVWLQKDVSSQDLVYSFGGFWSILVTSSVVGCKRG